MSAAVKEKGGEVKERKRWDPNDKLRIVLRGLAKEKSVSELSKDEGISPTQFYSWQKQLMENGVLVFSKKHNVSQEPSGRIDDSEVREIVRQLKRELVRHRELIIDLTSENMNLRKSVN